MVRRLRATRLAPDMAMALAGWLTAHVPDDAATAVLLWGDPGPHNVLTDDRGTITAVLDWELAMVGHPGVDLGAGALVVSRSPRPRRAHCGVRRRGRRAP